MSVLNLARHAIALAVLVAISACAPEKPGNDRVFVSNEQANVVHVIDGKSGRPEGRLETGERPRGLALSPDGRLLYVATSDADRIEVWDTHALRHIRDIGPVSDPERLAVSSDGKRLATASEDTSTAVIVDLATGKHTTVPVGPEPEGVGIAPDGRTVAVTSEVASVAHLIDDAGVVRSSLPVDSRPRDAMFLGDELWVSSELRGTVRIFSLPQGRPVGMIDLAAAMPERPNVQAVEMKASLDGRRVFVALGRGNGVAEIDPANRAFVRSFDTGERTWGIALSPDGRRLYAAAGLSGDLTIIDLAANKVMRTTPLGGKPWTVVAVPR